MSTPKIIVPRPDPTISSSGLYPASNPPRYRAYRWGRMPPVPRCSPAVSECTPARGIRPLLLASPPPGDIDTSCPQHIYPSSPKSACPAGGETPPGYSTSPPSPPNFLFRTVELYVSLPCTTYPGTTLLLTSSSTPLKSTPIVSALS